MDSEELEYNPYITFYEPRLREVFEKYLDGYGGLQTVAGLATALGVSKKTLYSWEKDKEWGAYITDVIGIIEASQEDFVFNRIQSNCLAPGTTSILMGLLKNQREIEAPNHSPMSKPYFKVPIEKW